MRPHPGNARCSTCCKAVLAAVIGHSGAGADRGVLWKECRLQSADLASIRPPPGQGDLSELQCPVGEKSVICNVLPVFEGLEQPLRHLSQCLMHRRTPGLAILLLEMGEYMQYLISTHLFCLFVSCHLFVTQAPQGPCQSHFSDPQLAWHIMRAQSIWLKE